MSGTKAQASQPAISGKALRRARNIVRRHQIEYGDLRPDCDLAKAIKAKRYARAAALIAWHQLSRL